MPGTSNSSILFGDKENDERKNEKGIEGVEFTFSKYIEYF